MQFLWRYIDDLVGKGLTFSVLAELLVYASATFVPLSLPLAILLASLMTFGGMGENYELIALKSAGISLTKIMRPLMILMVAISISAFFYSNISLPFFNWKMRSLLYDIQQQRPEVYIKEGVFYNGIENYSIKIGKKDTKSSLLHDIRIYNHSSNMGNTDVTLADSGYMKLTSDKHTMIITLFNGESYVDMPENDSKRYNNRSYPFRRDKFAKQVINIPLEGFNFQRSEEGLFRSNYQMMNLKQLQYTTDSLANDLYHDRISLKTNMMYSNYFTATISRPTEYSHNDTVKSKIKPLKFNLYKIYNQLTDYEKVAAIGNALNEARNAKSTVNSESQVHRGKEQRLRKHEIEWHKKFTLSLACIVFFFIGAPLGAIIRKGGLGMPLVISVLFFIMYYMITLSGEKFVRESFMPAYIGVWISSFILLPLGIFLTYKANVDAAIMNPESYVKFFKKIFNLKIWKKLFSKNN